MRIILVIPFLLSLLYGNGLTIEEIRHLKEVSRLSDKEILAAVRTSGGVERTSETRADLQRLGLKTETIDDALKVQVKVPSLPGFEFLQEQWYSCGKHSYTVKEFRHKTSGMIFTLIPAGNFLMGSIEQKQKRVSVESFLLAKYEVTQEVWQKVMGTKPWSKTVAENKNYAASHIKHDEAKKFCNLYGWRLPTTVEWEYAYRAGTNRKYYWGNKADKLYAAYDENKDAYDDYYGRRDQSVALTVGTKLPNAFGIKDIAGNVWERCAGIREGYSIVCGGSRQDSQYSSQAYSHISIDKEVRDYIGLRPCISWKEASFIEKIELTPATVVLKPGDHVSFSVSGRTVSCQDVEVKDITWSKSGGQLTNNIYTAGDAPGHYSVIARSVSGVTTRARIKIVESQMTMPDFTFLRKKTYSCGGQTHTVNEYRHHHTGLEFVLIPSGIFDMGSTKISDAQPIQQVQISQLLVAKYKITKDVWHKVQRSKYAKRDKGFIASNMNWQQAKDFCDRYQWRLPTEAEWEYACRAGTKSKYYWGDVADNEHAYTLAESASKNVGTKRPNSFGLHDMISRVEEWCEDVYSPTYSTNKNNPRKLLQLGIVAKRVVRGASAVSRDKYLPQEHNAQLGFRPCVPWVKKDELAYLSMAPYSVTLRPGEMVQFKLQGHTGCKKLFVPSDLMWSASGGTIEKGEYIAGNKQGTYSVIVHSSEGVFSQAIIHIVHPQTSMLGFTYLRETTYSCGGQTHIVKEYRHDRTGIEFVLIPGGSFNMGREDGWKQERPVRRVKVESFLMAKYEVSQDVWYKNTNTKPWSGQSYGKEDPQLAVTHVSWKDVSDFCYQNKLRLPTEAEWEYACRGGTTTVYYWGDKKDEKYAWFEDQAKRIGQKLPNAFGLYDMSGNVAEWCADKSDLDDMGGLVEPYIVRGVGWFPGQGTSTFRSQSYSKMNRNIGFRPCVTWEGGSLSTLEIKPSYVKVKPGERVQFTVQQYDKFGMHIKTHNQLVWTHNGGKLDTDGVYTAGSELGNYYVEVHGINGAVARAQVNISRKVATMPGFIFLYEKTYSCGDVTQTVKEYLHEETGIEFVLIPGGSFTMGYNPDAISEWKYGSDWAPAHKITLNSFLLAKHEISRNTLKQLNTKKESKSAGKLE